MTADPAPNNATTETRKDSRMEWFWKHRTTLVFSVVLILIPLLTRAWAYDQISLVMDDWIIFERAFDHSFYNEEDPQRPLGAALFALIALLAGHQIELLMLLNLLVFPAAGAIVLFFVMFYLLEGWLKDNARLVAFLIATMYLVHPANESQQWLTMIGYHLTHVLAFTTLLLWILAIRLERRWLVVVATILMLLLQFTVEAYVLLFLMFPGVVLLANDSLQERIRKWAVVVSVWYIAWGGYIFWRFVLVDDTRRTISIPTIPDLVRFTINNFIHSLRVTVRKSLDAFDEIGRIGDTGYYAIVVVVLMTIFIIIMTVIINRRSSHTNTSTSSPRNNLTWLAYVSLATMVTIATYFPFAAQYGENAGIARLATFDIESRAFQLVVIGIGMFALFLLMRGRQLLEPVTIALFIIAGGIVQQITVTYDYVQANNYQHTLWAQILELPFVTGDTADEVDLILADFPDVRDNSRLESHSWGFLAGVRMLSEAEGPTLFNDVQIDSIQVENGQVLMTTVNNVTFEASLDSVRMLDLVDGRVQVLPSLDIFEITDESGASIPLVTGVNPSPAPNPTLTELGEWYFNQDFEWEGCWTWMPVFSEDVAPTDGYVLIRTYPQEEVIDRRRVDANNRLDFFFNAPCNQMLRVYFNPDNGDEFWMLSQYGLNNEYETEGRQGSVSYHTRFATE